jgi:hypothetical protein
MSIIVGDLRAAGLASTKLVSPRSHGMDASRLGTFLYMSEPDVNEEVFY